MPHTHECTAPLYSMPHTVQRCPTQCTAASHVLRTRMLQVRDTVVAGAHDVDLHVGPFHLEPPLCAERDAGLCAAEGKCVDRIEIARLPLRRMRPVPSLGKRQALMAAVPSCDSVHYASAVAQAAKRGDPFDATTLQQLKRYYQELGH